MRAQLIIDANFQNIGERWSRNATERYSAGADYRTRECAVITPDSLLLGAHAERLLIRRVGERCGAGEPEAVFTDGRYVKALPLRKLAAECGRGEPMIVAVPTQITIDRDTLFQQQEALQRLAGGESCTDPGYMTVQAVTPAGVSYVVITSMSPPTLEPASVIQDRLRRVVAVGREARDSLESVMNSGPAARVAGGHGAVVARPADRAQAVPE